MVKEIGLVQEKTPDPYIFRFCYLLPMNTSSHDITTTDPAAIEALIASDSSPVGIDAKKTHIIIISKLVAIEQRLARLEEMGADKTI